MITPVAPSSDPVPAQDATLITPVTLEPVVPNNDVAMEITPNVTETPVQPEPAVMVNPALSLDSVQTGNTDVLTPVVETTSAPAPQETVPTSDPATPINNINIEQTPAPTGEEVKDDIEEI